MKRAFAAILIVAGLCAGTALIAVKVFFPQPRVRAWVVDAAHRRLGRDVRLQDLGVGLRGLDLRGLEVSERPDFAAGTFLRAESFRVRPNWRELLHRRLVASEVSADGLELRSAPGLVLRARLDDLDLDAAGAAGSFKIKGARQAAVKFSGSGVFAVSTAGAGKLQFQDFSADAAGLPLSGFTGTLSFDADRVRLSDVAGKLADGLLKMSLDVENSEIVVDASLDRFDLGRFLAAKTQVVAEHAAPTAQAAPASGEEKPKLVATRGHLSVGTLVHPNATVSDVKVDWDLHGLGGDERGLNGEAKLHVGAGKVSPAAGMAAQSKLVKILIFPLLIVQKIGGIGALKLLPSFNDVPLRGIEGDYEFRNGLMTLRNSEIDSDAAKVSAKGTIDLPGDALNLVVTAQVGGLAPIEATVGGTLENPKPRVDLGKLLGKPLNRLLQGLFGK